MSQEELLDTPGHQEVSESSIGNLSKLAGLARQAYEQKRTKDCLDLTRTILLIDPDNADAQGLRSLIQSQILQDLESARAFLSQAQSRDNSEAEAVPTPPVLPETPLDSEPDAIASLAGQETAPQNGDGQLLRSSVQSQIHQDLEDARAFLLRAQSRDNSEADAVPTTVPLETPLDSEPDAIASLAGQETAPQKMEAGCATRCLDECPLDRVRQKSEVIPKDETPLKLPLVYPGTRGAKTPWVWIAGALVVLGLVSGGLLKVLVKPGRALSLQRVNVTDASKPAAKANTPEPVALPPTPYTKDPVPVAGPQQAAAVPPAAGQRAPADKSAGSPSALSPAVTAAKQQLPRDAAANGTLAVSSSTSVDIYEGDQYLGSSPVSLELSVGMHTLEYRHGDLRRIVTQAIYPNETARAMIAFDATVQINSKPWAEVFLDGAEQKDLGQTPLSGVRVPIGSVLIFQNPEFQPKKYRVIGNETGIQIVFP